MRRLHFVGGCWRVPGDHYRHFEDWGQQLPPASRFAARCKDCFGKEAEKPVVPTKPEDDESVSETSAESSADEEAEVEAPAAAAE